MLTTETNDFLRSIQENLLPGFMAARIWEYMARLGLLFNVRHLAMSYKAILVTTSNEN